MVLQSTILSHGHSVTNAIATLPASHLVIATIGIYAVIKFLMVLYRLSPLHPLAKVPGPRFAAATWWFRTYYEVWPHPGELTNELHRLHAKYGPIVRIAPNEVHFASTSAYLHIYSHASKVVKDPVQYMCLNTDLSSVSFCDPAVARERRDIISPFFARRNVLAMQYVIEDKLCLFTHLLRDWSVNNNANPMNTSIDMFWATKSLTLDLIMEFCFAKTFNTLRTPGFQHPMIIGIDRALTAFWAIKHFPILKLVLTLVDAIPETLAKWVIPEAFQGTILLKSVLGTQVDEFIKDPEGMAGGVAHQVIYNRLLGVGEFGEEKKNGELVQRPKIGRKSLYDEAQALMFGGTDTGGNAISLGTFHILNTPGVLDKLMEELKTVWPGNPWEGMPEVGEDYVDGFGRLPVGWEILEKLPYLTGVIKESLRLSHGAASPLQRLATGQGVTIDGWTFPAGTGISAAQPFVHCNPETFPEPDTFRPERWIGPGAAALEKYLVPFSRGPRQCPGMNLAWCELYLAFATLFRRFEFELFETRCEDLVYRDYIAPVFQGRVKVRVKPRVD